MKRARETIQTYRPDPMIIDDSTTDSAIDSQKALLEQAIEEIIFAIKSDNNFVEHSVHPQTLYNRYVITQSVSGTSTFEVIYGTTVKALDDPIFITEKLATIIIDEIDNQIAISTVNENGLELLAKVLGAETQSKIQEIISGNFSPASMACGR